MRQRTAVPMPVLRVPRQAKDAHRSPHGEDAPGGAHEARTVHKAGQCRRLHIAPSTAVHNFSHFDKYSIILESNADLCKTFTYHCLYKCFVNWNVVEVEPVFELI